MELSPIKTALDPEVVVCLPDRLHPVSRMFLEQWLVGDLSTAEFLRWFHMPNSAYLEVAQCLLEGGVSRVDGVGLPRALYEIGRGPRNGICRHRSALL
jgi:hypothetical protein